MSYDRIDSRLERQEERHGIHPSEYALTKEQLCIREILENLRTKRYNDFSELVPEYTDLLKEKLEFGWPPTPEENHIEAEAWMCMCKYLIDNDAELKQDTENILKQYNHPYSWWNNGETPITPELIQELEARIEEKNKVARAQNPNNVMYKRRPNAPKDTIPPTPSTKDEDINQKQVPTHPANQK